MNRSEKIELIRLLEHQGILRELQPISHNYRDVAYWHFEVLRPSELPESLEEDFKKFGEIRW